MYILYIHYPFSSLALIHKSQPNSVLLNLPLVSKCISGCFWRFEGFGELKMYLYRLSACRWTLLLRIWKIKSKKAIKQFINTSTLMFSFLHLHIYFHSIVYCSYITTAAIKISEFQNIFNMHASTYNIKQSRFDPLPLVWQHIIASSWYIFFENKKTIIISHMQV